MKSGTIIMKPRPLENLFSTEALSSNVCLQLLFSDPSRTEYRNAYFLEQFARRIFDGDYEKAREALGTNYPSLENKSPSEVSCTEAGMLAIRLLIERRERRRGHRGVGALLQEGEQASLRQATLLLDFLPIAWGLADTEFEKLLGVPTNWLEDWRQRQAVENPIRERLLRLLRIHDTFRRIIIPSDFAAAWRVEWNAQSPIGKRSLWQAFHEDGDDALDRLENYLWVLGESS